MNDKRGRGAESRTNGKRGGVTNHKGGSRGDAYTDGGRGVNAQRGGQQSAKLDVDVKSVTPASDDKGVLQNLKSFLLKEYEPYIKKSVKKNPGNIMSSVSEMTKEVLSNMKKEIDQLKEDVELAKADSTVCTDAIKELIKAIPVKVQTEEKKQPKQPTLDDMINDLRLRVTRSDDLLKQVVEFAKDEENIHWKLQGKTRGSLKTNGISEVIADMEKSVEQVVTKIKFYREGERNRKENIHRLQTLLTTFSVSEKPSDKESQNETASLKNQQAKAGGEITLEKGDTLNNVIESLANAIRKEKEKTDSKIKELEMIVEDFNVDPSKEEEKTTEDNPFAFIRKKIEIQYAGHLNRYKDILKYINAHLGKEDVAPLLADKDQNQRSKTTPQAEKRVDNAETQKKQKAKADEMKNVIKDLKELTESKDGHNLSFMVQDLVKSIDKIHLAMTGKDVGQKTVPLLSAIEEAGEKLNTCENTLIEVSIAIEDSSKFVRAESEVKNTKDMADKVKLLHEKISQNGDNADKTVREMNHTIEERKKEIASLNKDVTNLKQENQELLVRLSKYAGAQLRDNNPNITDLSDPNRPTKLAEEFSKLYDDEWTNAFDEMDNVEDTDAIARLYRVFKEAYTYCMKQSTGHLTSIRSAVIYPSKLEQESEQIFPAVISTSISDFRKATATVTMNYIVQAFETRHDENDKPGHKDKNAPPEESKPQNSGKVKQNKKTDKGRNNSEKKADGTLKEDGGSQKQDLKASVQSDESSAKTEAMQIYTKRCVELCWLAVVQEPPLVIDFATTAGNTLDTDFYRLYTKQGKKIDYVVWPAVFLEKGNGLLSKGVAQGM